MILFISVFIAFLEAEKINSIYCSSLESLPESWYHIDNYYLLILIISMMQGSYNTWCFSKWYICHILWKRQPVSKLFTLHFSYLNFIIPNVLIPEACENKIAEKLWQASFICELQKLQHHNNKSMGAKFHTHYKHKNFPNHFIQNKHHNSQLGV